MTGGQRRGPGTPPRPRRPPGGAAACPAGSGWRPYAPAVLAASRDTADSATALSASTPCARPCGRYPPISANTTDGARSARPTAPAPPPPPAPPRREPRGDIPADLGEHHRRGGDFQRLLDRCRDRVRHLRDRRVDRTELRFQARREPRSEE